MGDIYYWYVIAFELSSKSLSAEKNTVGQLVCLKAIELEVNLRPQLWLHGFNQVTKTVLEVQELTMI